MKPRKMKRRLIYDVGLHIGQDTAYYLKKGFQVVAFEANPDLIASCNKRFSKEIACGDLIIVEGAIVGKEQLKQGAIEFYQNEDLSVLGTVVQDRSIKYEESGTQSSVIEVQPIDFSECLKKYGIPYYLKIDIEGMDVVCLEALQDFEEKPAYVSMEAEKGNFQKLQKEFELLEKLGYATFQIINQANISSLQEPKDSKEGRFLDYEFEMGASGLFGSDMNRKWISKEKALSTYKSIFYSYKLWGDDSKFKNYFVSEVLRKLYSIYSGRPMHTLPGWFDTHAKHTSLN